MRVVYFADDGTEFDTEKECRDYELKTADFFEECANVRAYDDDRHIVNFEKYEMEYMENAFQEISFIQFNTQKAIDLFMEKGHECGLLEIEEDIKRHVKVGERYFYDWNEDEWRCLDDVLMYYSGISRIFTEEE